MEGIPQFNPMDFKIVKKLDKGSFGSVILVENKKTHKRYAAKEQLDSTDSSFHKELQTYKKTHNSAILQLLGYSLQNFKLKEKLTLFTEFMKNGSLEKSKNITDDNISKYIILLGVALGMKYLHSEGIIHRDLKPANVLLNDEMEPKICDFGLSKISDKELTEILMNNAQGTPLFMAPEIFDGKDPYNYKVDVYAFSFFAYQLITGKSPFYERKEMGKYKLRKAVLRGERPDISIIKDENIKEFLKRCWSQRPSDRPSFLEIVDELMKDKFKKSFNIVDKKDIEKVDNYLKLFDDDLKSPNSKDALDVKRKADDGNIYAILQYANMLLNGYGVIMNKEEAVKYFKRAADLGNDKATYMYAYCLRHGSGIEKNINEAIKYYKKSAELGNSLAMVNLGHLYRFGKEIPQNYKEAIKYYRQSASKGNTNAMANLGLMMYHGEGFPQNKEEGKLYLKKASLTGNSQAMFIYGSLLLKENNKNEGMNYLKMSADLGNVDAMSEYCHTLIQSSGCDYSNPDLIRYLKMAADHGDYNCKRVCQNIGITGDAEEYTEKNAQEMKNNADDGHIQSMLSYAKMCYSGEGVEINKKEAAAYFKKAADLGESYAMFEYGKMLINGDGIPENKLKGMDYLEKSVEKQDVNVMYLYGQLLRKGEGVPSDKIEGANYLKLSADKGNPKAKFAYGQMLLAGEGIPKNEEEGLRLIEQSTILNPDMMVEYGEMLKNGEIITVNKKLAAEYFEKAVHLFDPKAMYLLGLMKIAGDGIKMNRNDGMRLLKFAADCKYIDAMRAYAGFLILYQDKEYISEAVNYIKIASEKGDLISFYLYKYVFHHLIYRIKNEEMHYSSKNTEKNISNTTENTKNPIINVNIYDSYIFENNNFAFLQHSTIPQSILDEFLEKIQNSKSFRGIQSNSIHQNDPNSIYTYYFLSSNNHSLVSTILNEIMQKHNIQSMKPNWNVDMFFNEKIIPTDVLNLLLPYLKTLKNIKSVVRNVFDGRQIASYILLQPTMLNVQKYINDSIQDFLLPKGLIFDKIKYPLEKNIIINEELILKNKKDFDLIIEEIQKIGIEPINIERNRLYLYGDYFIRKLFQTFSFICFKTENEKMEALNHINSIVYATKKNVLKYKMNLHYAKIDDSAYPKNVRDNLVHLFESFKGIQDIQEHVLSIENPVVRTYVGFDSLKHLKKAYKKFFHYVDILRFSFSNPNFFLKKKNLIYLYIEKTIDPQIENIISNYFASDVQKNCIEFYGDIFALNFSQILELNFYGFDGEDNLNKAVNLLRNNSIKYFIYHGIRSFINKISDVPEEYLFYDSF